MPKIEDIVLTKKANFFITSWNPKSFGKKKVFVKYHLESSSDKLPHVFYKWHFLWFDKSSFSTATVKLYRKDHERIMFSLYILYHLLRIKRIKKIIRMFIVHYYCFLFRYEVCRRASSPHSYSTRRWHNNSIIIFGVTVFP